jgi:hypothetical protein
VLGNVLTAGSKSNDLANVKYYSCTPVNHASEVVLLEEAKVLGFYILGRIARLATRLPG